MSNPGPAPDGPSPLSATALPSSFDSDPDFFEESRFQKLWRKLRQEPLIPVGCAATCYALYMATKSIRQGDHHQTNRMFRARIYAQGFTLLALVAGSIFYKDERVQRKKFEAALEEKKTAEKRDKWIQELEARDREDQLWREKIEAQQRDAAIAVQMAENPDNHGSLGILDQVKAQQQQTDAVPAAEPQGNETTKQKGIFSWFGKKDSDS
ncbi:hypothetical protein B0A52_07895 [Exophiala mesophila]|uniref:HIG1 domain-containing protein n=1 Tax=Exophiala mesophila TaxID=212818 RepID=A0A438MXK0_EXOME|nr:hypothetical protein B0A52_07895 [Exophiala mesophila]